MTTAAIYARYSTDKQDARSIDDQLRRCREHAERLGLEVIAEFHDAATSGTHTNRAQLRGMLDVATATKRPPFRVVIVDDLSRLSRDVGNTHSIIAELASVGVKLFDLSTGIDSESENAELTIGMHALINSQYIRAIRKQTHRGLTGRALAGFSTGGKVYGYTTRTEDNPPDREHPRMLTIIDEDEAAIVRRVFALFIEGAGLKSIADTLNRESIRAPHDNGKGNKGARGWTHGTIRNVLRNERYLGRWTWNTSKWLRSSTSGKRRRVVRPKAEHVVRELPELVIIDRATWDRVASRLRKQTATGGRTSGVGKHSYLTSGLLRCGTCNGSMSVVGQRTKAGVRYATFGCSAHNTRGAAICDNGLTISERRITTALIESMRELFTAPDVVRRMTASIASKIEGLSKPSKAKPTTATIAEVEQRIRNLTEALASAPTSAALVEKLCAEERRLADLKATKRSSTSGQSVKAPTETQVRGFLSDLVGTLEADPVAGRAALADLMSPLTLTPTEKPRGYSCRAVFRVPSGLSSPGRKVEVLGMCRSGGAIRQCIYRLLLRFAAAAALKEPI